MSEKLGSIMRRIWFSRWTWAIIILVLVRILSVQLAFMNIPFTDVTNGVFVDSGDGGSYYRITNQILDGDLNYEPHFIGFFLFLSPLLLLAGPAASFLEIATLMAWVNGVGLYVIATILVWILAKQILKSKKLAHTSAFIFLIYPYVFYYIFYLFSSGSEIMESFMMTRFMQLNFLNLLSDPLSSALIYASLALLLYIIVKERPMWIYALMGFLLSFFVITRTQNVFSLLLFIPTLLILKRYKGFAYFALAGLPLGILQMVANFISGGSIFASPYGLTYGGPELNIQMFSITYPLRIITYPLDHIPILLVLVAFGATIIFYGLWRLIRDKENKRLGWVISGYLFFSVAPLLFIESVMRNPRYFLSVIPLFIIISIYSVRHIYLNYVKERIRLGRYSNSTRKDF
jgi:hypothetical protein